MAIERPRSFLEQEDLYRENPSITACPQPFQGSRQALALRKFLQINTFLSHGSRLARHRLPAGQSVERVKLRSLVQTTHYSCSYFYVVSIDMNEPDLSAKYA